MAAIVQNIIYSYNMIRESQGRLVFQPLSISFGVLVLGGSWTQQYDADTGEYEPDRALTPLFLGPELYVTDPDKPENSGNKTGKLVNVSWQVEGASNTGEWQLGKDYVIVENTLRIFGNVKVDTEATIRLTADYYDNVRGKVYKNTWERKLSCSSFSGGKFSLQSDCSSKLLISPFNCPDRLSLTMQLMNNGAPVDDEKAQYVWHVLVNKEFVSIDAATRDFWYISGVTAKTLVFDPRFVGTVFLRCTALPVSSPSKMVSQTVRLQRFYGQYSDDLIWLEGRLKFTDTPKAAARIVINRKAEGYVENPTRFFDIEMFYDNDNGMGWQHLSHTDYGEVDRNMFPVDAQHKDKFGWQVREKSELVGVHINGIQATAGGIPIVFQVPQTPR